MTEQECYLFEVIINNGFKGRKFVFLNYEALTKEMRTVCLSNARQVIRGMVNTVMGCKVTLISPEEARQYPQGIPEDIRELYHFNKRYFDTKVKPCLATVLRGEDEGEQFVILGRSGAQRYKFSMSEIGCCCRKEKPEYRDCSWRFITLKEARKYLHIPPQSLIKEA